MKNIQKIHIGEDYTKYSFENSQGETEEVEITGIAQDIINCLGEALHKESFLKLKASDDDTDEAGECRFIITDPCYIMDDAQYDKICREDNCNFEGQDFPLSSTHKKTGKAIIFHKIEGTPNGDGSYIYKGQDIGVDAGMLCIAEVVEGDFADEEFGAMFTSLNEASKAFPKIISKF